MVAMNANGADWRHQMNRVEMIKEFYLTQKHHNGLCAMSCSDIDFMVTRLTTYETIGTPEKITARFADDDRWFFRAMALEKAMPRQCGLCAHIRECGESEDTIGLDLDSCWEFDYKRFAGGERE